MTSLVTGGTGYIGSHTCVELLKAGYYVVAVDNFFNSKPETVNRISEIAPGDFFFYELDVLDEKALREVFSKHHIDGAIHFAGYKAVGESVEKPLMYYRNNVGTTLSLCRVMEEYGVNKLVFSSSATVYGQAETMPIDESFPLGTSSPYGTTKLMIEYMLTEWANSNKNIGVSLLRYFNPVGAHPSGLIGEDPNGIPNNLMPYICRVADKKLPMLTVFGDDYETPDGTGVRDYIHVVDLAKGHIKALDHLLKNTGVEIYNLGTGNGLSVLELVNTFSNVNNIDVPYKIGPRRSGDVTICYANADKAKSELGWVAEKTTEEICKDSWNFICKNR